MLGESKIQLVYVLGSGTNSCPLRTTIGSNLIVYMQACSFACMYACVKFTLHAVSGKQPT